MAKLMRCLYCGLLQDEPSGVKTCAHCGGELVFESEPSGPSYVKAHMELDQISAPADQIVDRHLVVSIHTPDTIPAAESAPTESGREPLGFAAVLDTSGSMRGEKLTSAKEAVRQAFKRLQDGDQFALVTFANDVQVPLASATVGKQVQQSGVNEVLGRIQAGGQTALCGGLEAGIAAAASMNCENRLILLLSDGQANVGETDIENVGRRSYEAKGQRITSSTLGVGSDYNEALMVEIAIQGGGRYYHVQNARQIVPYVAGELGEASALAAQDAVLHLQLPAGTGLQPFSSAYTVEGTGGPTKGSVTTSVRLGDIPIDTDLEVVIRLLLPGQSQGSRLPIEGTLTYRSPADHELTTPLNVVTLRFVGSGEFNLQAGAVEPVVRRVLEQMKARGVLGAVRARATKGEAARLEEQQHQLTDIQRYAALLGEEEAQVHAAEQEQVYAAMAAPASAKAATDRAFRSHHGTKRFDQ